MFDGIMRRLVGPPLERCGRALARRGVSADALTAAALVAGLASAAAAAAGRDRLALLLFALNRLLDGLDGAVARAGEPTERGGFLDIVFDFAVYGAVPLAFAIRDPGANALPAAALLFSFYVNGASFLAFAAVAARRGLESAVHASRSIYASMGLAEGTETIVVFVLMLLRPDWFPVLALAFAGLTAMSAIARVTLAAWVFAPEQEPD